ncbi:sigma-70 family RNA polymerase sigma factor [Streptomyces ferrugineus]|uniref:RNA polymerase sigma factor n=1 Tax=Streptomyces ferrugineus TaxID=1413221 RepID=A0A7M2SDH0_9ACTN|nr:sigma-70 family RNA polymerase sigma factor [Streptomyces ferrugineus]QOV33825.1 sigma-70 family RNA polymerase sigma factor [Streptomyces ferrugineus]
MSTERTRELAALVTAARSGDPKAQDALVSAYLPLVYNIVGRALNGSVDVDDVVQETMLRALDALGGLRTPESFRSWLVAIAMNQVRAHWHDRQTAPGAVEEAQDIADPGADFVDLTMVRLQLSGQRQETALATRWLEPDDRGLLSLWWLECAGELTRAEVAAALELSPQHTAVRVQRMKAQLEAARVVVRALDAQPPCDELRGVLASWDGQPSALWRKRIARHARGCVRCSGVWSGLMPAEGLLAGLALVAVAPALAERVLSASGGMLPVGSVVDGMLPVGSAADGMAPVGSVVDGTAPTGSVVDGTAPMGSVVDGTPTGSQAQLAASAGSGGRAAHRAGRGRALSRGEARRRRRVRRRAVGGAVVAACVAGGGLWFHYDTDPGNGTEEATAARTAGAPVPDLAQATPIETSASPSPSRTPSKSPSKKATPSKSPRPTKKAAPAPRPTPEPTRSASSTPQEQPAPTGAVAQVVALVNKERSAAGCGPLEEDALLNKAAQGHSDDMAARGFFDHTNPDGADPGQRITAAGYRWSTFGENIAQGQQTPEAVMESWMNSPGHRANILNCSFKDIGVGINKSSGGPWWTQNFGAKQ